MNRQDTLKTSVKLVFVSALITLLVMFYYRWWWGTLENYVVAIDHCKQFFCDFTRHYYTTGQELFVSGTPHKGYFYTAFFAILMAGVARFSEATAVSLWVIFQLISVALLFLIPAKTFYRKGSVYFYLYLLLVLTAVPVLHNFKWGQISVFMTVCILGTWYFYENGRKLPAALLLAFAIAIKYYAGFFLIYFVLKKEWKWLITVGVATVCFLILIPILLLGVETNVRFFQIVSEQISQARSTWMLDDINSQYFPSVGKKWAQLLAVAPLPRPLWQWVGYGIVGLNLLLLVKVVWQKTRHEGQIAFALLFLSFAFLIETSWPHYFTYLPFCHLVALQGISWEAHLFKSPAFLTAFSLLLLSLFGASIFCFNLFPEWQVYSTYSVLFLSNLFVLPILYYLYALPLPDQYFGNHHAAQ